MGKILDLLNASGGTFTGGSGSGAGSNTASVISKVGDYVGYFTIFILVACGLLVTFFAVYVGFKLASAEEDGKRKEAKNQLIYSIIGIISIVMIAVILRAVVPKLGVGTWTGLEGGAEGVSTMQTVLTNIQGIITPVLELVADAGIVFAVYIGWNLMKAEDDGKRKQAKMQLIYTIIGVVSIVLLNVIVSGVVGALVNMVGTRA
jgi:heme/copper-type cytochrome/quinol oxidase subunit 2